MEYERRPAVPEDLDWAYDLFKRAAMDYVVRLAGEWPEPWQYEFFREGFFNTDMVVLEDEGRRIGMYCVHETECNIRLKHIYLEPEYRGQGIARTIIGEALEKAHEVRKPLELEVLITNKSAERIYEHLGFRTFGFNEEDWVVEVKMRHRDTEQYVPGSAVRGPHL